MVERGKFVVFEGAGGSGKSLQLAETDKYLTEIQVPHFVTREPGGVPEAESIRKLIFNLRGKDLINADHQMALYFAARNLWVEKEVGPKIEAGKHGVSDRSYPSTGAFQGYGEGGDLDVIEQIAKEVMGEYMPDAIVLLDISAETSVERNMNTKDGDPFDDLGLGFHERVVDGYRLMARENWSGVPWFTIDAERTPDEVFEDVKQVLHDVLGLP